MNIKDLITLASKSKTSQERINPVHKFALGIGVVVATGVTAGILFARKLLKKTRSNIRVDAVNAVEIIKDTVEQESELIKNSAAQDEQDVRTAIKNVYAKEDDVKKEIKNGSYEVTDDINKTVENVSKELKKPIKEG